MIELTSDGLYCPAGGFHIDPWKPVPRAIVTHAHSDHLRGGCDRYLVASEGLPLARLRLGQPALIETLRYGEVLELDGVRLSLHPAGHILGSAQVRLEHRGRVCVISGDYKTDDDPTCGALEQLRCHEFVTESTFGLPLFRWPDWRGVVREIEAWWRENRQSGKPSLLLAYACGKAQRLLASLDASIGPIFLHGAVERVNTAYLAAGVRLPETQLVVNAGRDTPWREALIIAPPSARGTPWMRRFPNAATALASGWMRVRGMRRRRAVDRGFVISDHADWSGLLEVVRHSEAETIRVTHGYSASLARYLAESGRDAAPLKTQFHGELLDEEADGEADGGAVENTDAAGVDAEVERER